MAWAEQLPNGLWRAFWRDSHGNRHSKSGFRTEPIAKRYGGEQESKARRGDASYDGRSITWGEWRERWLELRRVEPSTKHADAGRIENHLRPVWDKQRLGKITRSDVQAWVNLLDEDESLSPATVRRIYYLLSASMKAAVKDGKISQSPCNLIDLPTPAPANEHYLTRPEFDLTLRYLDEPYRTAAILLVGTGMRFGEMAGLHWGRVDFEQNQITVAETWDKIDRKIKPYPKTKKPRHVPLPQFVIDALLAKAPEHHGKKCGVSHASKGACASPLVLRTVTGLPLDYSTMREQHWIPALQLAGVEHTRLHDLRHTYASWLRQDGIDLEVVQELLGHGSILTTQRYSHIGSSQHEKVLRALGDASPASPSAESS
jgi:integrase